MRRDRGGTGCGEEGKGKDVSKKEEVHVHMCIYCIYMYMCK